MQNLDNLHRRTIGPPTHLTAMSSRPILSTLKQLGPTNPQAINAGGPSRVSTGVITPPHLLVGKTDFFSPLVRWPCITQEEERRFSHL